VHPLVEADFPDAPTWLNEGIASVFEAPVLPRPGEIHGTKNWRLPRLLQALDAKGAKMAAAVPKAFFAMDDDTFRGEREPLNYANARYFCLWLDPEGWLWTFYQRWRDTFSQDASGEKAFADITGKSPADIEAEWILWVRKL